MTENQNANVDTIRVAKKEETFEALFSKLIDSGKVTKDSFLGDVKFTMSPLSTNEFLESESIYLANFVHVPKDVIERARMISNLAYAITAINDILIHSSEEDGEKDSSIRQARARLYEKLSSLPPYAIDILYKDYKEMVSEQSKVFSKAEEMIENF